MRIGLAAGADRKLVAKVRKTLPPMAGKREARDGKAYSPRGMASGRRHFRTAPVTHPCG